MIDTAYIIESADYRMFDACPEILTPDIKTYKRTRTKNCAPREMVRQKIMRGHFGSRKTGAGAGIILRGVYG